ncbi:PepSY domain-containing protein [Schlegelella sp. S2-27]|uniref:PepSY domain-containing protein n=1 Tax=Caldimonas mangrovi TaxID=2944811 RepID=A0ABT0YPJ0_9BURK|nr:PepSY domain-containing protein [Caldimonas mangrovi]MCM5680652.1 PepSY domain-containing protein [Caldimonas mangrovi]
MKRWLFLAHRWLGLAGCLLILLWFASGFVMMYVPYPELTDDERLPALKPLDVHAIKAFPSDAAAACGAADVLRLRALQPAAQPIFAVLCSGEAWRAIDARDGAPVRVDAQAAARAAEQYGGAPSTGARLIDQDQWSISTSLHPHRPLWRVEVAGGGVHYVSSRTGEVVRDTSRMERGWNWVGAVVHWLYPTVLRSRSELWHWTVVGLSAYALFTAILGTVIGVLRWRRYASGRRTPYRGWMMWHHMAGLGTAVFVLAWLLSGLLSMNPGGVFSVGRLPPTPLNTFTAGASRVPHGAAGAKEIEWIRDGEGVLTWVRRSSTDSELRRGDQPVAVNEAYVRRRVSGLGFGAPSTVERLDELDLYYHARNASRPLPVWRVRFADPQATWVHVDGRSGQVFSVVDRSKRVARWLYHGLHSWDFQFLLQHRPLWNVLMLAAMAAGFFFSVTSVVVAWRRLTRRRPAARAASPILSPQEQQPCL